MLIMFSLSYHKQHTEPNVYDFTLTKRLPNITTLSRAYKIEDLLTRDWANAS